MRHLKVGSVIVREHLGKVYEVLVVPSGFCCQGQIYSSLSTIAGNIRSLARDGTDRVSLVCEAAPIRRCRSDVARSRGVRPSPRNVQVAILLPKRPFVIGTTEHEQSAKSAG